MYIKKTALYLIVFFLCITLVYMAIWWPPARYTDPFYNFDHGDMSLLHLPLVKPIKATRLITSSVPSTWEVSLSPYTPWVSIPNSDAYYPYAKVVELEKFAVKNGVIMAYSAYVDTEADGSLAYSTPPVDFEKARTYIRDNYYHWFVIIPDKEMVEGFHTEDEFNQYIQTLDIQNLNWHTPEEAYKKLARTGCLEWIPDCK